ncbi:MAG: hypothetical protein V1723_01425 [Candidatus Uhrbacteria bacterium]
MRTDRRVKARAQRVADRLGLSLDVIVNAYLRQLVRDKEVYFSYAPRMSKKLARMLGPIEKDIKAKRNIEGPYRTPKEVDAYFDAL